MKSANPESVLTVAQPSEVTATAPAPTPTALTILEAAVRGGITPENVAVAEKLIGLAREQKRDDAKASFARSFFELKKNMPEIYADKIVKDKAGGTVCTYCSEEELSKALEPHLLAHGFTMMFGQTTATGTVTVNITLMHCDGHSEERAYTVRVLQGNSMMDAAKCDAGSATLAWRHLVIKLFGLKSRITADADARVVGENITPQLAEELQHRVKMTNSNEARFLKLAGIETTEPPTLEHYKQIMTNKYQILNEMLRMKEGAGR